MKKENENQNKLGQIYVHCKFDEFLPIIDFLKKEYGFVTFDIDKQDSWPIAIDFDTKTAFSINSATLAFLTQQAHGKYLNAEECIDILKNHKIC